MKFQTELAYASLVVGMIFLSGCVGQPSPQTATTTTTTFSVGIASNSALGNYLVDSKGMTFYHLTRDVTGTVATPQVSNCIGNCRGVWPVFYTPNLAVAAGLDPNDFTVFTRSDGAQQVAFKGTPLYYYSGDQKPGDVNGQGVQNVWFVVSPSATSTTGTSTTTTNITSSATTSSTTSAYRP